MNNDKWSWQHAIISSDLPPTTRHILLTLACHMTPLGERCFPSLSTIAKETGLARNTVWAHLAKASEAGWLKIVKKQRENGSWHVNEYWPKFPMGRSSDEPAVDHQMNQGRSSDEPGVGLQGVPNRSSNNRSNNRGGKFTPPSRDEIVVYLAEKGYKVDPDVFLAHYESVGWKVGKNKMKSWRAALAGWHYRNAPPPKSESDGLCL